MKAELFGKIEFPSDMQKEQSISQIISQGIRKPQKLSCALWEVWNTAGVGGICFGVWDCMLLAMLLNGILWAAVYASAKQNTQILGILVFLASPVLYASLHLLTVCKERMAGMYETLMVCRLTLRQLTVIRLMLSGGASLVLSGIVNLWIGYLFRREITVLRLLALSMSALFFYAWMQMLLEFRWKKRLSCWAAPVIWSGMGMLILLLAQYETGFVMQIPEGGLMAGGAGCAVMYLRMVKECFYEMDGRCG